MASPPTTNSQLVHYHPVSQYQSWLEAVVRLPGGGALPPPPGGGGGVAGPGGAGPLLAGVPPGAVGGAPPPPVLGAQGDTLHTIHCTLHTSH